jgi:hypothetical protein
MQSKPAIGTNRQLDPRMCSISMAFRITAYPHFYTERGDLSMGGFKKYRALLFTPDQRTRWTQNKKDDVTVNAFIFTIVERGLYLKILSGGAPPTKNNKHWNDIIWVNSDLCQSSWRVLL